MSARTACSKRKLYGTIEEFNQVHSTRRREIVLDYIRTKVDQGDQDSLKAFLQEDLADLRITL